MKSIWLTVAIACLAVSSTARADVWGRVIPNTMIARTQDKVEPVPEANGPKSAIQAPHSAVQNDGYPFSDRCGCNKQDCCANVWDGYSSSCGWGIGRGMFAHSLRGSGVLAGHGCNSGCNTGCGEKVGCGGIGHFNSFGGGAAFGGCGCGTSRGFGWHGCGLQSLAACGKHHLHGLRRACGLGCDTGCTACSDAGGCNSCNGKSHHHDAGGEKNMSPPVPPGEPTPMSENAQDAPTPATEKSAFRPSFPSNVRRSPLGF